MLIRKKDKSIILAETLLNSLCWQTKLQKFWHQFLFLYMLLVFVILHNHQGEWKIWGLFNKPYLYIAQVIYFWIWLSIAFLWKQPKYLLRHLTVKYMLFILKWKVYLISMTKLIEATNYFIVQFLIIYSKIVIYYLFRFNVWK